MSNPGNLGFGLNVGGRREAVLLQSLTLVHPLASIVFDLPDNFTHIELLFLVRSNVAGTSAEMYVQFNSDAGANYDIILSQAANGAHTGVARVAQTVAYVATINGDTATAGTASFGRLFVPYYLAQTYQHTCQSFATHKQGTAVGNLYEYFASQWWRSTAPIRTMTFTLNGGSFMAGNEFSLYGLQ